MVLRGDALAFLSDGLGGVDVINLGDHQINLSCLRIVLDVLIYTTYVQKFLQLLVEGMPQELIESDTFQPQIILLSVFENFCEIAVLYKYLIRLHGLV